MKYAVPSGSTALSAPNPQLELFGTFFGPRGTWSNTIELWDAIPKFAVSLRRQAELRDANGRLPVFRRVFSHARTPYELAIQPAAVRIAGGSDIDYYPSAEDELVEDVLRKLFAEQRHCVHDARRQESWVSFSLQQVRKELAERGRTRSLDEIKHAVSVLSRAHLMVYRPGTRDPVYSASILMELCRIDRQAYQDDTSAHWRARLPLLVSASINALTYRQLNYDVLMRLPSQFARWLHKRLSHTYINASMVVPYTVLLSTLVRDSGLLDERRKTRATAAVASALDALVAQGVLSRWNLERRRPGSRVALELKYTLFPDVMFVGEMKAANARTKHQREVVARRLT